MPEKALESTPDKKVKLRFWSFPVTVLHPLEMSLQHVWLQHGFSGSAAANWSGGCVIVEGFIPTPACCLGWSCHRPCLATAMSNRSRCFIKEPLDSTVDWFSSWGHFSGFCAKATLSPRKIFTFLWLKNKGNERMDFNHYCRQTE